MAPNPQTTVYVIYGYPIPFSRPPPHKQGDPDYNGHGPTTTAFMNGAAPTQQSPQTEYSISIVTTTATPTDLSNPTALADSNSAFASSYHTSVPSDGPPPHKPSIQGIVFGTAGALAAAIGVLVLIGFIIAYFRKQRRRKQAAEAGGPEMAMKTTTATPPYTRRPPTTSEPSSITLATSTTDVTSPTPPRMPEPVILPNNGSSYFTGIDTSDHMSILGPQSIHSSDNIYPSGNEEPPPPYRPCSVPPISRESSLRVADGMRPNFSTIRNSVRHSVRNSIIRSPFDDTVEEDADIEENPFGDSNHQGNDRTSVVSDLSYQQEPTSTHSTI